MAKTIPSYELYGELLAGGPPGPIHHETIRERSSKHDWTIRLHRHRRLAQIFLFGSSDVRLHLGEMETTRSDPTILVVPPGIVHGFLFSEDVIGDVISIRLDEMPKTLQQRFGLFSTQTNTIFSEEQSASFNKVTTLIEQLREAYKSVAPTRSELLTTLIELITLYLHTDLQARNSLRQADSGTGKGRRDRQVEHFCTLLENNFQHPWTVAEYAQHIGLSAPHLTRICRVELGSPPNDLVRQRRMLEAKRLLEYTALNVSEIAQRCGFRDAAFFSRTFKHNIGVSPIRYRSQLNKQEYPPMN